MKPDQNVFVVMRGDRPSSVHTTHEGAQRALLQIVATAGPGGERVAIYEFEIQWGGV